MDGQRRSFTGIAIGPDNSIYMSLWCDVDEDHACSTCVAKKSPGDDKWEIVAGGTPPGTGTHQLGHLTLGLAVDVSGNLYVSDGSNHRIVCWETARPLCLA